MNNYSNPVTVTGNPASFEASGNGKLLSLSVPFSPIQDLHGYDNPWPAGGGKNLLPKMTADPGTGLSVTVNDDGSISVSGTATGSGYITNAVNIHRTIPSGTAWTFGTTNNVPAKIRLFLDDAMADVNQGSNSVTVSNKAVSHVRLYMFATADTAYDFTIKPQLELGSTATAYSPYSNICPITGRTGLSVHVSPTQDPDDATVYNVEWSTQAGTVYGGTVDVVTGELVVDRGCVNISSSWNWLKSSSYPGGFFADIQNAGTGQKTYTPFICSHAKTATSISQYVQGTCFCDGSINIRIMDGSDTVQDWKDYINAQITAGTPIQICYELATPITYQLTPQEVETLVGQNNVWSDSNEAVTLTYVIELLTRYTFIVNGNDYTGLVERDSYRTAVTPVYGETIQTLDGVGHTALLRVKGSLTVKLNPQTAAQTAAICADLLNAPCEVQYKCLQRNVNVTALMVLDVVSAVFLSRCLYLGQKWNDVDEIVLKEL